MEARGKTILARAVKRGEGRTFNATQFAVFYESGERA
jgi:hypothetical protein